MPYSDDHLIARVDRLERDFVEIRATLDRIEHTLVETRQTIAEIRRNLARSVAPVARDAPDGTAAIRDPDIIAQQYRTKVRGHAPGVKPIYPSTAK